MQKRISQQSNGDPWDELWSETRGREVDDEIPEFDTMDDEDDM